MSYPCYCCGKPTKGKTAHYVVTTDGREWMPHSAWLALCERMGYNSGDPETALGLCGVEWRPESYGSTCYRREKSNAAHRVEIISPKGERFLFIG